MFVFLFVCVGGKNGLDLPNTCIRLLVVVKVFLFVVTVNVS